MCGNEPGLVRFVDEAITDDSLLRVTLSQAERIRRALAQGPLSVQQIAEATGIGEPSVRVGLSRARGKTVTRLQDGRWALLAQEEGL